MRTLLALAFFAATAVCDEPMFLKEEIKDPGQLTPAERQERAMSCLQLIERFSEGDAARSFVGPLLMLRAELCGDLAERAAKALSRITGEDFGTDFERWQKWFDGVKATERWAPTKLYTHRRNPKYVLEGPEILVAWSAEPATEIEGGGRRLKGPCALRCPRLGFYAAASGDLEIRWNPDRGEFGLKSGEELYFSAPSGNRGFVRSREATFEFFTITGIEYRNLGDLRKVPQLAEDAKLGDADPAAVMRYVCEQAQAGNFLPTIRVIGEKTLRKLADPAKRKKLLEQIGLPAEEAAKLTDEDVMTEWLRKDYLESFLFLDVKTDPKDDGSGVSYHIERFGGSSGGTLAKRDGRWIAKN